MNSTNRMAFNTIVLYANLVITIVVNLYATRLILNALGVSDYGIVNLISGIVAMLSFVQNSMTVSTQRFMSVSIGKRDKNLLSNIFNSSLTLHLFLSIFIIIILESLIPVVFNSSLQIPADRIFESKVLYHCTVLSTVIVFIGVPFDASINAHEDMVVYAISTIVESIVRMMGAFILIGYEQDKLLFYAFLVILVRLCSFAIKLFYCILKYKDAKIDLRSSSFKQIQEMFSFAFWNMFGALSLAARNQGVAIVMNTFWGIIVNAAYGIAVQISGQLSNFTATISKAIAPQIMQREGAGDSTGMLSLSIKQSRISSFLLLFMVVPLYVTMDYLLVLWLKEVPDYTVSFCKVMVVLSFLQQLTVGLQTAIQAKGKIRNYQLIMSIIILMNLPFCYLLLKFGFSPVISLSVMLAIELACIIARVWSAKILVSLNIYYYIKDLIIPVAGCVALASIAAYIMIQFFFSSINNISSFVIFIAIDTLVNAFICFCFLDKEEKRSLFSMIKTLKNKLFG